MSNGLLHFCFSRGEKFNEISALASLQAIIPGSEIDFHRNEIAVSVNGDGLTISSLLERLGKMPNIFRVSVKL